MEPGVGVRGPPQPVQPVPPHEDAVQVHEPGAHAGLPQHPAGAGPQDGGTHPGLHVVREGPAQQPGHGLSGHHDVGMHRRQVLQPGQLGGEGTRGRRRPGDGTDPAVVAVRDAFDVPASQPRPGHAAWPAPPPARTGRPGGGRGTDRARAWPRSCSLPTPTGRVVHRPCGGVGATSSWASGRARGIRCTCDPSGPPRSARKGQIRRRFAARAVRARQVEAAPGRPASAAQPVLLQHLPGLLGAVLCSRSSCA